jgi:hypothetical protein
MNAEEMGGLFVAAYQVIKRKTGTREKPDEPGFPRAPE